MSTPERVGVNEHVEVTENVTKENLPRGECSKGKSFRMRDIQYIVYEFLTALSDIFCPVKAFNNSHPLREARFFETVIEHVDFGGFL